MLRLSNNSLPSLEHTFMNVLEGDEVTFHHLTPGKGQHKKECQDSAVVQFVDNNLSCSLGSGSSFFGSGSFI